VQYNLSTYKPVSYRLPEFKKGIAMNDSGTPLWPF
jgi:hypothetical protein